MAGDRSGARIQSEGGYTLVVLAVFVTVLSILVAAALPMWSHAIQREKEEELISRGLQYAEAIRIFQIRFQRPPVRLEELLETKPRCIRRLWKDPMTEDGKWGIIFVNQNPNLQVQPGAPNPPEQQLPEDPNCPGCTRPSPGGSGGPGGGDQNDPHAPPKKGDTVAVGPITGVHSKSHKKSILVFNGRERYDEWHFTTDLINQTRVEAQGAAVPLGPQNANPGGGVSIRSMRWIGRPFPPFMDQVQNGNMPNGQTGTKPQNPRGGFQVPPRGNPRRPGG